GVGTHVAPARVRRPVELTSLHDDLTKSGRKPSTEVPEHRTVSASAEVAEALELPEGTEVVMIRRLRMADGEPLAVLTNYVPLDIAPTVEELAEGGLYDLLRSRGAKPKVARQRIGARSATAAEARTLGEKPRAALLTMERTAYDDNGKGIEFGQHIYRASRYMFDTMLFAS
ncbi:MAG TPA: GntR family transcriptional regulator, partial [Streptomyces sp.]|nr:GntR family transcriptional regulator [Streptomyces sp.]